MIDFCMVFTDNELKYRPCKTQFNLINFSAIFWLYYPALENFNV